MIVTKDSKSEVEFTSLTGYESSSPGASASTSSPPPAIMSPLSELPLPTPAAHMAPPAYSVHSTAGPSQPSSSTRGISDGPSAPVVNRDRDRGHVAPASSQPTKEHSSGHAISRGILMMALLPVVAFLALLWAVGKVIEGTGKWLVMGPEAAYRSYQAREEHKESRRMKGRSVV